MNFDMVEISRIRVRHILIQFTHDCTETKGGVERRQPVSPTSSPPITQQPLSPRQMETLRRVPLGSSVMWLWVRLLPGDRGTSDGRSTGCDHLQMFPQVLRRNSTFHKGNIYSLSIQLYPRWHKARMAGLGLRPSELNRHNFLFLVVFLFLFLSKNELRPFALTKEVECSYVKLQWGPTAAARAAHCAEDTEEK